MKETWFLWDDQNRPPQENMDIDLRLLHQSDQFNNKPLVRFYGWDRPAISIGYVQKLEIIQDKRYAVVKRPTGGGVVYHDIDFTYTVVIPAGHWIVRLDRVESYRVIHKVVVKAFAGFGLKGFLVSNQQPATDRATMQCFVTPTKYDVLVETPEGRTAKFAGSAQRRTRHGILHQGSILLAASGGDRKRMRDALKSAFENEFDINFEEFQGFEIGSNTSAKPLT